MSPRWLPTHVGRRIAYLDKRVVTNTFLEDLLLQQKCASQFLDVFPFLKRKSGSAETILGEIHSLEEDGEGSEHDASDFESRHRYRPRESNTSSEPREHRLWIANKS